MILDKDYSRNLHMSEAEKKEREKFYKIVKNKKFDRIFNFREELVNEYLLNDKNCDEVISFLKKNKLYTTKGKS